MEFRALLSLSHEPRDSQFNQHDRFHHDSCTFRTHPFAIIESVRHRSAALSKDPLGIPTGHPRKKGSAPGLALACITACLVVQVAGMAGCASSRAPDRVSGPGPERVQEAGPAGLPERGLVVFVGDSITWQGHFTDLIAGAFLRRRPGRELGFENRGLRGDTAGGALERLGRDVLSLDPAAVVVLLGANDAGHRGFQRGLLRAYLENMERIVRRVRSESDAAVVLVTPLCVAPGAPGAQRTNRMLGAMAGGLRALSARMRVSLVDLHPFFCRKLDEAARMVPPVTLMADRLHPDPAGHLVIAHFLLDRLDPHPSPAGLTLHDGPEGPTATHHGRNMYLPRAARPALRLVPFQRRFNPGLLEIEGLQETVRLSAGDAVLGPYAPAELARGLDLNLADGAPWCQEARRVHRLLVERRRLRYRLWDPEKRGDRALRDVWPGAPSGGCSRAEASRALERIERELGSRRAAAGGNLEIRVEVTAP